MVSASANVRFGSQAAEVAALYRMIVEEAQRAGVRIGDNDNWG